MERHFENSHNPKKNALMAIGQKVGVSETQVQVWFKNRRAKERRLKLKADRLKSSPNGFNAVYDVF